MRILRSLSSFQSPEIRELTGRKLVGVTIGNFDALHLGHQRLFKVLESRLSARPAEERLRILITFWPHPRRVLAGVSQRELLSHPELFTVCSLRHKLELVAEYGFDICYVIPFRKELASLAPREFIERHVVSTCKPAVVVVGDDWAFGKGRAGNTEMLAELGKSLGFAVEIVKAEEQGGVRVSTSAVKDGVRKADFCRLESLLGRPYAIVAHVRGGDRRGRELGFPTANIECPGVLLPPDGIYAGWAEVDGERYPAAIYIGSRPTFGPGHKIVESYLIDQTGLDLYGKRLNLEFAEKIRDDRRFSGPAELSEAIARDVEAVRRCLAERKRGG